MAFKSTPSIKRITKEETMKYLKQVRNAILGSAALLIGATGRSPLKSP